MNLVPEIRLAQARDHVHLRSLDVKCFDYCWNDEDWGALHPNLSSILVACFYSTPVAMLVCSLRDHGDRKVLLIHKVCVREHFRQKGLSKQLLAVAYDMQKGAKADDLAIEVVEHLADPKNPANCLGWLEKMGFRASHILLEKRHSYGQAEDVFLFTFKGRP
jgi:GNAT superfamily N-acetyltransferase